MKFHWYGFKYDWFYCWNWFNTPYGLQIDCGPVTITFPNGVKCDDF